MIRLQRVSKSYSPGTFALQEITLEIEKGEFVFLTGPSGAGKTTLLRLLLREELPTSGTLAIQGKDVAAMKPREVPYLRRKFGVVFQDFKLIESKTVLENLRLVQEAVGVPAGEQRARAMKVLRQVSLQHKLNAYPLQLSGGEQQRVAIARALVNEPLILLADEPTGNLDADLASEIMQLMREINARGTTVMIATHDREMIRKMARRSLHLAGGRLASPSGPAAARAAAARMGAGSSGAIGIEGPAVPDDYRSTDRERG